MEHRGGNRWIETDYRVNILGEWQQRHYGSWKKAFTNNLEDYRIVAWAYQPEPCKDYHIFG